MEQPPPVPPPPPDYTPAASAVSNSKLYTTLAWVLLPPLGSFVLLFLASKDDAEAKFNAANATAVHGVMLAGWIVFWVLTQAFLPAIVLLGVWDVAWFAVWVFGVVLAAQSEGRRFRFPVATDTLAAPIAALEDLAR
jgi:uncharacterized membrane protein